MTKLRLASFSVTSMVIVILFLCSQCSKTCGTGVQVRVVTCRSVLPGNVKLNIPPNECIRTNVPEPEIARECTNPTPCPRSEFCFEISRFIAQSLLSSLPPPSLSLSLSLLSLLSPPPPSYLSPTLIQTSGHRLFTLLDSPSCVFIFFSITTSLSPLSTTHNIQLSMTVKKKESLIHNTYILKSDPSLKTKACHLHHWQR